MAFSPGAVQASATIPHNRITRSLPRSNHNAVPDAFLNLSLASVFLLGRHTHPPIFTPSWLWRPRSANRPELVAHLRPF